MTSEIDALDPRATPIQLSSGTWILIEALRARQFFKLLRIITHGALPLLRDAGLFEVDQDPEEFGQKLLSVMVMAVPDAEDQTIDFLLSMVKPHGLTERRPINKQDKENNERLWQIVYAEMSNPDLGDLLTIVEAIVRQEAKDIQALGKRLAAMFQIAEKTGQIPPESKSPTSPEQNSSEDSPARSTSSRPSTDGTTNASEISLSADSGSASQQFVSAGSTPSTNGSNG